MKTLEILVWKSWRLFFKASTRRQTLDQSALHTEFSISLESVVTAILILNHCVFRATAFTVKDSC